MSIITWVGYAVVTAFWGISIWRDGGLGIGIRFMYGINLYLMFLFGPLLGAVFGQSPASRFNRYHMEPAINLTLVGMVIYVTAAYWIYPYLARRRSLIPADHSRLMAFPSRLRIQHLVAWNFIIVGLLCSPLIGRTQGLATIGAVLAHSAYLVDTGMVMLCMYSVYSRRNYSLMIGFGFYLLKYLLFASLSGHVGAMFVHGMVIFCLWLFSDRIRLYYIPILLLSAFLAFIPAAYWLNGRGELRWAIGERASAEERIDKTLNIFLNPPPLKDLDLVEMYRLRGDFSDLLAAAMMHTPLVEPYAGGETYLRTFTAIIPRAIWPDKPITLGGNEYASRYTGIKFNENTSIGTNYIFEMYINFGRIGVYVGMLVLGLLIGWMESLYYARVRSNIMVESLLVHASWTVCFMTDKFYEMVMSVIPGLVLVWIVFKAICIVYDCPARVSVAPARKPSS